MSKRYRMPGGISPRMVKAIIGGVVALLAGVLAIKNPAVPQQEVSVTGGEYYRVAYVNDGDTIKLDNGERVRLIGIDTPESRDNPKLERDVKRTKKDKDVLLAMGRQAAVFSKKLLSNQRVRLEFDVERHDRYGRLLAYVYLADGSFVNEKIIREGYAYPMTVPPNVRYADDFKQWFDEARENKRGLWK